MHFAPFRLALATVLLGVAAHAAAPLITSPTSAPGRVGYDFHYTIATSPAATDFEATGLPEGLYLYKPYGQILGQPTRTGTFPVTLSASNSEGTGTLMLSIEVEATPTRPPVIPALADYYSHHVFYDYPNQTLTGVWASNYPDTFTVTGGPAPWYFDRAKSTVYMDYNKATPGTWHLTFTASNAAGTGTAEMVWFVHPAVISYSFSKSAQDIIGSYLSEYVVGERVQAVVRFDSAVEVTGAPRIPLAGWYDGNRTRYAAYASGSGTDTLVFELPTTLDDFHPNGGGMGHIELNGGTIRHASGVDAVLDYPEETIGHPPPMFRIYGPGVITSAATASGTVGEGFLFNVTAKYTSSFSAEGLPPGLAINPNTGVISGIPTLSGAFTVMLSAINGYRPPIPTPLAITLVDSPTGRPTITTHPPSRAAAAGTSTTFTTGTTTASATFEWQWNGKSLDGATNSSLVVNNVGPGQAGVYTAVISDHGQSSFTQPSILGIASTAKVIGTGSEVGANIVHANGNVYDQVLLQGAAATVTADRGQVVRVSFLDLNDDIVQVEFSGAGTLSIVLDSASGPVTARNYNQPDVAYMKGHAGIAICGADESTNVSIFSVGRLTAVNQALFRSDVDYDGTADIAFLAIESPTGHFGGARLANTSFWSTRGITGVYAPGVSFSGPLRVCDIIATEDATPMLYVGEVSDATISGGDLLQTNGHAVQVHGISRLRFVDGTTSGGMLLPVLECRGRLEDDGRDVTAQIVAH